MLTHNLKINDFLFIEKRREDNQSLQILTWKLKPVKQEPHQCPTVNVPRQFGQGLINSFKVTIISCH